jgi:hypothetical protein
MIISKTDEYFHHLRELKGLKIGDFHMRGHLVFNKELVKQAYIDMAIFISCPEMTKKKIA